MSTAVALHEAGHAVAAWALGFTAPGPVTIVGGEHYGGITFPGAQKRVPGAEIAAVDLPWPLLPPRIRRYIECDVMSYMAGDLAAAMFTPTPPPVFRRAGEDWKPVGPLPPREAAMLAEADEPGFSDAEQIDRALDGLHGERVAIREAHRGLLEVATEQLLRDHEGALLALAAELDEHRTLSAARWRSVVRAADTRRRAG